MKILLVDDTEDERSIYELGFRAFGHDVTVATNGIEAVKAVQQDTFDVILLDVHMPRMDGWEALRRIAGMPHAQQAIIALLSALVTLEDLRQARRQGAHLILQKPTLPSTILLEIHKLREKRQQPQANEI